MRDVKEQLLPSKREDSYVHRSWNTRCHPGDRGDHLLRASCLGDVGRCLVTGGANESTKGGTFLMGIARRRKEGGP